MEYKISELMGLMEDDSVELGQSGAVSPDTIKEAVMLKIHQEDKKTRPARRYGRTLLIAAVIVCMMLATAVAAGADPLSIFGHAREEQRHRQEMDEQFRQSCEDRGEEYQAPDYVDSVDLDAIATANDQTVDIDRFTTAAKNLDDPTSGGDYTGPELKGIRVHLKESYYDGQELRLGVALESLGGSALYLNPMSDGSMADTEDMQARHQEWYISDHILLEDGSEIGPHGSLFTPEGLYINFDGLPEEAQGKDELTVVLKIRSYLYDPDKNEGQKNPTAEEAIFFTIPNTAK